MWSPEKKTDMLWAPCHCDWDTDTKIGLDVLSCFISLDHIEFICHSKIWKFFFLNLNAGICIYFTLKFLGGSVHIIQIILNLKAVLSYTYIC